VPGWWFGLYVLVAAGTVRIPVGQETVICCGLVFNKAPIGEVNLIGGNQARTFFPAGDQP